MSVDDDNHPAKVGEGEGGGGGEGIERKENASGNRLYSRTSGFESMIINDNDHSGRIWLHAFYHSVVVCIGAGVLALPFATSHLGYIGAVVMALLVSSGSYYTATLLISLQTPDQGTYSEVADAIMGGTWFSRRVVRPFQLLYLFPISAVFLVLGGNSMYEMDRIINGNVPIISEKVYEVIVSAPFCCCCCCCIHVYIFAVNILYTRSDSRFLFILRPISYNTAKMNSFPSQYKQNKTKQNRCPSLYFVFL